MRRCLALLTCASLLVSGCATAGAPRVQAPASPADRSLLAGYVRQLPVGARVRVDLSDGTVVKGTLMQASEASIVVQRRTRIPEPPDTLGLDRVTAVQLEPNGGPGRAIAIGAAAGAAAALGVFLILAAIFAGD
jgi:hypothetical protein